MQAHRLRLHGLTLTNDMLLEPFPEFERIEPRLPLVPEPATTPSRELGPLEAKNGLSLSDDSGHPVIVDLTTPSAVEVSKYASIATYTNASINQHNTGCRHRSRRKGQ